MTKSSSTKKTLASHVRPSPLLIGSGTVWQMIQPESLADSCHRGPHKSSYIKKSTQPAEQRTNGCIPSMIWIAQLSTPLHIPCLWIIWWLPQSIRSMFYVFVFPCAVFVGLRKLQVVNRPRSGRVQAWPDDSSDAYMRLRGRARHRRTQRRRSARNTGRANPPVTSDGIQTPSGGTLNVRGSIMESSSIVPLFVFFL